MRKNNNTKKLKNRSLSSYDSRGAKIVLLAAVLTLLCSVAVLCLPLVSGAAVPAGSKGEIDVYLIAGQSNAVGYGYSDKDYFNSIDTRFTEGFSDVFLWRDGEGANKSFVPVKLGMGQNSSRSGAEIGIAHAVADSGRQSAVIKVAVGDTGLYPHLNTNGLKSGTWTPPSYLAAYGLTQDASGKISPTSGSLTGNGQSSTLAVSSLNQYKTGTTEYAVGYLYRLFIQNVKEAVAELRELGYTPVLKGMWWMQGERETWIALNNNNTSSDTTDAGWLLKESDTATKRIYSELLACFIKDVRAEMSNIFGTEQGSNMPFVFGRIHHNQSLHVDANGNPKVSSTTGVYDFPDHPHYLGAVQAAQDLVANSNTLTVQGTASQPVITLSNVAIVDIMNYEDAGRCQQDKWHFNARAQQWLGEQFIAELKKMEEVTVDGVEGRYIAPDRFLPSTYQNTDIDSFVFAVFYEGEFRYALNKWSSASTDSVIGCAHSLLSYNDGKTVEAYMLNDYSNSHTAHSNIGYIAGNIVVDMMGHTLETTTSATLFNAEIKHSAANPTDASRGDLSYVMKNGEIKSTSAAFTIASMSIFASNGTYSDNPRSFNFRFDNVRINTKNSVLFGTRVNSANANASVGTAPKMRTNFTFNDCVITSTAATPTLFNNAASMDGDTTEFQTNVYMNGGEISLPGWAGTTRFERSVVASNRERSYFLPSDSGGFFALRMNNSYTNANYFGGDVGTLHISVHEDGTMQDYYWGNATQDANSMSSSASYTFAPISDNTASNRGWCYLALPPIQTNYGKVAAYMAYIPTSYPILVFYADAASVAAGNPEFNLIATPTNYGRPSHNDTGTDYALYHATHEGDASAFGESVILFRQNYTSNNMYYENLTYSNNHLTIDLGGFSINVGSSYPLLELMTKSTDKVKITVKNGTVNAIGSKPILSVGASGNAGTSLDSCGGFIIEMRNINVIATGTGNIIDTSTFSASSPYCENTYSMYDCTFNMAACTTAGVIIFNYNDTVGHVRSYANYYGGRVIYPHSVNANLRSYYSGTHYIRKYFMGSSPKQYMQICYISSSSPTFGVNITNGSEIGAASVDKTNPEHAYFYVYGTDSTIASGFTYYVHALGSPVVTKYGNVAPEIWNDSGKRFLVFDSNKALIASTSTLTASSASAFSETYTYLSANHGATVNIMMIRNSTESNYWNNVAYLHGEVLIDLNGKTLTYTNTPFSAEAKGDNVNHVNITVLNGKLVCNGDSPLILATAWSSGYKDKDFVSGFNYVFERATFEYTAGSTATSLISHDECDFVAEANLVNNGREMYVNATFNNCTFDMRNFKGTTIFDAKDPKVYHSESDAISAGTVVNGIVRMNVNGGKVINFNPQKQTELFDEEVSLGSYVKFGPYNGSYTAFELVTGGTAANPEWGICSSNVEGAKPGMLSLDGANGVYRLVLPTSTIYGDAPTAYYNYYNFLLFDDAGNFLYQTNDFCKNSNLPDSVIGYSVTNMRDVNTNTASYIALMLKDYSTDSTHYDNLSHMRGALTVDLNGHVFTSTSSYPLFELCAKADARGTTQDNVPATGIAAPTNITMKNGSVRSESVLMGVTAYGDTYLNAGDAAKKVFNMNFEDLTISFYNAESPAEMLFTYSDGTGFDSKRMDVNATFTNCVFDITGAGEDFTLFNANDPTITGVDSVNSVVNVDIIGGGVVSSSVIPGFKLAAKSGNGSGVKFTSLNGVYPYVRLADGNDVPYALFSAPASGSMAYNGELPADGSIGDIDTASYSFIRGELIDGKYDYVLTPPVTVNYETVSGPASADIVTAFASNTYLIFSDGKLVAISQRWEDAIAALGQYDGATLRVTRDDTLSGDGDMSAFNGSFVIDMAGFTLARGAAGAHFIWINADLAEGESSTVNIKVVNGNITNAGVGTPIRIDCTVGHAGKTNVNLVFNGVNITNLQNGGGALFSTSKARSAANKFPVDVNAQFIGCSITDLYTSGANRPLILLSNVAGEDSTKYTITFDSCALRCVSLPFYVAGAGDSITYVTDSGSGVTLTLPQSVIAPNQTIITTEGMGVFGNGVANDAESVIVYTAISAGDKLTGITIKSNVTFMSEIVYNVYIPALEHLSGFSVDGIYFSSRNFSILARVTIDGKDYYRMPVSLDASSAARTIMVGVTVNVGGSDVTKSFSIGLTRYAEKALAGNASDVEKQLIVDMMSYVKSAYIYFGTDTADGAVQTEINRVLGEFTQSSFERIEGAASDTMTGFNSVQFVLGATPSIRFYIDTVSGYKSDDFSLYQNIDGSKLTLPFVKGSNANGEYIETRLYAYRMCSEIFYSINGTDIGKYHMNSYYDYVSGDEYNGADKDALIDVFGSFYTYCKSAKAYKDSKSGT